MTNVRTRFAPSPTGLIHVGGIRTALFAWLLARQNNGQFILRLEDTDKKREVAGADQHIIDSLRTLGLDYDEGPDAPGNYGPYRQSERLDVYRAWAGKLVAQGRAYADPYSPDEVQAFRELSQREKRPFLYRNHRPDNPPAWDGSQPLRFLSEPKNYEWHDEVIGDLSTGPEVIDDFVLIKSDGYPTYNFAHIVDDELMRISHIIRGQEFIPSVPGYLNVYEAMSLTPPVMATMPPILGPDGNKKLSKRDGAKDILDYIEDGFLPTALLSFIATLGWNDGSEQELFTTEELIEKFSLQRVGRGGARFDERRLQWVNGSFIRTMDPTLLLDKTKKYLPDEAHSAEESYNLGIITLVQERLKFFKELPELTMFFYKDLPVDPTLISSHKKLKKYENERLIELLELTLEAVQGSEFTTEGLTQVLNDLLTQTDEKPMTLFSLIRIATTQASASPPLAETMVLLGKDTVVKRIKNQLETLA